MDKRCDDLVAFADGELDPVSADEFRAHLRECETCLGRLVEAMQMGARLSQLTTYCARCGANPCACEEDARS